MALLNKVESILIEAFPPPDKVKLGENDGIVAAVISTRFEGLTMRDRMNMIWEVLNDKLNKMERRRVLTVVAVTPVEERTHSIPRKTSHDPVDWPVNGF